MPAHPTAHDRQAAITHDLAIYGAYAPHFRYRQERIAQAAIIANISQPDRSSRIDAVRERVGLALIAWGTRLEGGRGVPPGASAPLTASIR